MMPLVCECGGGGMLGKCVCDHWSGGVGVQYDGVTLT